MKRLLLYFLIFLIIVCKQTVTAYDINKGLDNPLWKFRVERFSQNQVGVSNDIFKGSEETWKDYKEFEKSTVNSENNIVWRKHILPVSLQSDASIFFSTYDQAFEVYLDETLIYSFGSFHDIERKISPGSPWHMISLPQDFNGKTLYLKMLAMKNENTGYIERFKVSSKGDLVLDIVKADIYELVLNSLFIFLGIASIILYGFFRMKKNNITFLYLGLSSVFMGLWLFSQTDIKQFFLNEPVFWLYVSDLALYLIPVWFYMVLKRVLNGRFSFIMNTIIWSMIIFIVFSITLDLLHLSALPLTKKWFHILLSVTIPVVVIITLKSFHKSVFTEKLLTISFTLLCIFGFADIFRWYIISTEGFVFLSQWGMLLFILALMIVLINQLIDVENKVKAYSDEIKLREAVLDEKRRLLQEALNYDKLKTEFFVNVSHELRTPLNIILSTIQLINLYIEKGQLYYKELDLPKHLTVMRQNCYRLTRLVNNFIDISKFDSGYMEPHLEEVNLIALVEDTVLSAANYISSKSLDLTFDTNVEEKLMYIDPEKLERIILNLLSNAIKFSQPGASILVEVQDNGASVNIIVSDTGIGIPPEKLQAIFERFVQVDRSLSRSQEGSGIGLALVKSLVQVHKGSITVDSICGKGSKFVVTLPADIKPPEKSKNSSGEINGHKNDRVQIEFSDIPM